MVAEPAAGQHNWTGVASQTPIRAVHVVPRLRGGPETQVRRLCERLVEYDVDVTVVTMTPDEVSPQERAALGVPVVEVGTLGKGEFGRVRALAAELRKLKPIVLHLHGAFGRYAGRFAAILGGKIPIVVLTLDETDEQKKGKERIGDSVLRNWTTQFVVSSQDERKRLVESGVDEHKVTVIPASPLATAATAEAARRLREKLSIPETDLAMILPGRFAAQKNQRLAMRALARGIGDAETAWLVLIGEGPDDAMLRREASRLGITTRVLFLTPQWDPVELLPAMQLFLIPSNFERLPVTLIDAMLAGVPVVSSPWEGFGEFLIDGETGFVATDWSQEAFAEAILRALADPARLRRVADRARTFALERFDMDPAARRLASLYRTLAWKKRV